MLRRLHGRAAARCLRRREYFEPVPHREALREGLAQAALLHRSARASGGRLRGRAHHGGPGRRRRRGRAPPRRRRADRHRAARARGLHAAGLRSLGLVWSRRNAFATGVPFGFPGSPDQGPGLTDAGRALVRACGELGIVVDLSHFNERGFWEVADLSDAPLVASHSNAHVLCASPRNLTDDQLRAIGERGGLVGINFFPGFLRADGAEDPETPITLIAEHAAHVAQVAGPGCVGLGSDFDGATMPSALRDVTGLPALLDTLRSAGFTDVELEGIASGNWRRVLAETWGG